MLQAVKFIYHKLIGGWGALRRSYIIFITVLSFLSKAEAKMTCLSYDPNPANIAVSYMYINIGINT